MNAFHLPKYLSYIGISKKSAFPLIGCGYFFGGRFKEKTNSYFGINTCRNHRLETPILGITCANAKPAHRREAGVQSRALPRSCRSCGVSVCTINLHFLGS